MSAPLLVTTSGWVLFEHRVGRLRHFDAFAMLASLRADGNVTLPAADEEAFLARLYAQRTLPRLALPEDLSLEERAGTPAPHLKIGPPAPRAVAWGASRPIVRPRSCRFATTGRRSPSPTRGT